MSAGELLLELLSEEIPARMQRRALADLTALLQAKFAEAQVPAQSWRGYVTPRRLAVIAEGIPARQPDRHEERRGPRVGAPPQALEGFLRGAGLTSVDQCEIRDTGRGEFYFAVLDRPGAPAAEVLPALIRAAIGDLPWPKSMRYPASALRWVRPLQSAICLFDGAVLPLPLDGVPVGRTTGGHRFLSPGEITVESAADYEARLGQAHVVLDLDRRKQIIEEGLSRLAAAEGLQVKPDPGLLEEVAGLVEYPVPLIGTIDDDCMALPPEVLATAMRAHQKYFTALKPDGSPAPRFLFVANNETPDRGKTIVAGNERVLRARLADARFFWDQDRKTPLADRVEELKQRVYHEKLGSVYDKVERMEALSEFLAKQVAASAEAGAQGGHAASVSLDSRFRGNDGGELAGLAKRAAHLGKADLSTGMVGEFPELQGVMGRYYALHDGEDAAVADAIADHYKPLGPTDSCPTAPVSIITALADKLDSLAAFFSIDERPTGSGDPFALRRAAQGIIRLILENQLRLPLRAAFTHALDASWPGVTRPSTSLADTGVDARVKPGHDEHSGGTVLADLEASRVDIALLNFVFDRLRVHVREQGISHDLIAAARNPGPSERVTLAKQHEDDLTRFVQRVRALQAFLDTEDGANLLIAYRRASNIVAIEEKKDSRSYDLPVETSAFRQDEERVLYQRLSGLNETLAAFLEAEAFDRAMQGLATLRAPVDEFFAKVTVNADEPALRENRLRLLSRIRATMNLVADFSQIEG